MAITELGEVHFAIAVFIRETKEVEMLVTIGFSQSPQAVFVEGAAHAISSVEGPKRILVVDSRFLTEAEDFVAAFCIHIFRVPIDDIIGVRPVSDVAIAVFRSRSPTGEAESNVDNVLASCPSTR